MDIGYAIQLARKKRKLTQTELAELALITPSYLSMLERNRRDPPVSTVRKIAEALRMPVEILFFLGAEGSELGKLDRALAGQLAYTALELLNDPVAQSTPISE